MSYRKPRAVSGPEARHRAGWLALKRAIRERTECAISHVRNSNAHLLSDCRRQSRRPQQGDTTMFTTSKIALIAALLGSPLDHASQAIRVGQRNRAAATLDEPGALERLEFACDRFPPRAHACGNLGMHRRGRNDRASGLSRLGPRQPQKLGVDAVA